MGIDAATGADWSKVIVPSIVPIVIISAVALISQTIYSRLALVLSRFREFERERLHYHKELTALKHERKMPSLQQDLQYFINTIEMQKREFIRHFKLLKMSQFCLLFSIGAFIMTSFSIGIHVFYFRVDAMIITFFVLGMLLFLAALYFSLVEIHLSGKEAIKEANALDQLFRMRYPSSHRKNFRESFRKLNSGEY